MARILSVEDDPDLQQALSLMLTAEGHEFHSAFTGEQGCEKAISLEPDLILLDMMLPSLNGLEVIKVLREDPKTLRVPVVVMTSYWDEAGELERSVRSLGVLEFLRKPVKLADLCALVARLAPKALR